MGSAISIYPIAQKHRTNKQGQVPIVLRIDLNSDPAAYDPVGDKPYKIPIKYWDNDKRVVLPGYQNAQMINLVIAKRRLELEGIFLLKESQGMRLTKQRIKSLVKGIDPGRCFLSFCKKQIKDKYNNKETIRTYTSEVTKLEQYQPEVSFLDIDYGFLQEYAAYMRDDLKNEPNTIWKTFKFMNTMFNDALRMGGIIDESPFGKDKFDRGKYRQTTRTFLTKAERVKLERLLYTEIPEDLYKVVVYQLFMCYAGLRYEDAMAFDYNEHIVDDERLIMITQKADEQVNIKLYPKLREMIAFVRDHPLQISNAEFNRMLKVAATMAGIDKNLTAHVGRHSFGRMLAENGVDIKKAQKLLAHRDDRSTRVYYHRLDVDVDNEVDDKLGNV